MRGILLMLTLAVAAACGRDSSAEAIAAPGRSHDPLDPAAIETLLNETAERMSEPLAAEGRGYSYYGYGTTDLLYALGDLDGDGRPEIAARAIYFLGVGSYDLVDIFADRGDGYTFVDRLNLYHLDLEDEVEALEIRDGLLHIATIGSERGRRINRTGVFRWPIAEPTQAP